MQNMTPRNAMLPKNYILDRKKSILNIEIFLLEIEVKKISLRMENTIS